MHRQWQALAIGVVLAGCKGQAAAPAADLEAPPVAVRLAEVGRGDVPRPIRGTGVVRLKREMDLSFKVGGVVANVLVEEGATVRKGQVLARLDPTEVDAALRQAKESQAKAERDFERVKKLHGSGALAVAELENAKTGLELTRAGVDAASFNAQRASIVAPDDGRVDKRFVEAGEVVAPGRPCFHMSGQSKGAVVRIGISDRDVLRVHEGDRATVTIDARPDQPIAATVSQVATVASAGAGTFDVEVRMTDTPDALLSGLTAKVAIDRIESVPAIVPIGAVAFEPDGRAAVFVVDAESRARRVPVKVAFLDGERVALARGIEATRVVDAGAGFVEEGSRVRVVP